MISENARESIRPRKMDFPFAEQDIPRYWMGGVPLFTHMSNGINLLFPKGERFFIRSVQAYRDQVTDARLLEEVKAFMAQEVRHGMEHEAFFDVLREQGYDIDAFMRFYDRWAYALLEPRFGPAMRLSVTVALEHYTAIFGELALIEGLPLAHPALRDLFLWHAAEEIEHKSVAFDVLKEVDPRYSLRVAGLVFATAGLLGFWFIATRHLMRQDRAMGITPPSSSGKKRSLKTRLHHLYLAFWERPTFRGMARGFLDYLRPDFRPDQHDNYELARTYLESIGRLNG